MMLADRENEILYERKYNITPTADYVYVYVRPLSPSHKEKVPSLRSKGTFRKLLFEKIFNTDNFSKWRSFSLLPQRPGIPAYS